MAEAFMPRYNIITITLLCDIFMYLFIQFNLRFGHGAFLVCLESLYKKITGQDLIYTGKSYIKYITL